MPEIRFRDAALLAPGGKKLLQHQQQEFLLLNSDGTLVAVQSKCPHAQAPLEKGALCDGRLVCPWHMATFAVPSGHLLEPPATHGLTTYAIRVEGDDILLDPDPIEDSRAGQNSESPQPDARTFLLAGAGAAGLMAAVTLREQGFTGRIVMLDPQPAEPVDRTQLSKQALSGKKPLAAVAISALDDLRIDRFDAALTAIEAGPRLAKLSDGQVLHFDAALLATGGTPLRPRIAGIEHAFTLRHSVDLEALLPRAVAGAHAVVLGGSFIALEAASALVERGLVVTVVAREKQPFAQKFGEAVAEALLALHRSKGVQFLLEAEAEEIRMDSVLVAGQGLHQTIAADLVLLGLGVEPALDFEHGLKLAEDGGLATDASLQVADHVWVAGDIASVDGTRIEHWRLAQQHGRVAAMQMLGHESSFTAVPFFWTFHYDKRLGYLGHADEWDEIELVGSVDELKFAAIYLRGGQVEAVLTCGYDHQTAVLSTMLGRHPGLAEVREALGSQPGS